MPGALVSRLCHIRRQSLFGEGQVMTVPSLVDWSVFRERPHSKLITLCVLRLSYQEGQGQGARLFNPKEQVARLRRYK